MSEPKQISPLLDGFTLGDPISEHDGVKCCPAIKEESENKYIVKIISIPASQVQMDALLLSGAYKDAAGAMDYYKMVAADVTREAEKLRELSKLDGFLSFEGWQTEPITRRRLGYEVYLVSEYRRSLDKFVRRNPITQLEAINLGLDMCAALSVCRQSGALYVDLKPTNIFVSDKKEYRIGDLGFVSTDALSYTALPDKYRSAYTPPELSDPMASVNMTVDTYALGMILYQIYNDGQLPPPAAEDAENAIPSPVHADYELADIILKAIAKNPEDRWQDPKDMGHALVSYMQRNVVNDVPITPYVPLDESKEKKAEPAADEPATETSEPAAETPAQPTEDDAHQLDVPAEENADQAEDSPVQTDETAPSEADAASLLPHEMSDEMSRMIAKADDLIAHETPDGVVVPEIPEPADPFAFAKEDEIDDADVPVEPVMEEPPEDEGKQKKKKTKTFASQEGKIKRKKFFSNVLALGIAAAIGFAVFWAYTNVYIQTIDNFSITGDRTRLTVNLDTRADESKLTVTCADQYGNILTQTPVDGRASFTGLQPNTMYTVSLDIEGYHKLAGQTSQTFTTDTTTNIVAFTSMAGPEDGSLILNFTVDGDEPEEWAITYSAEGIEERRETFTGHSFSIGGLKLGKVYTFTLDAGSDLSLSGKTSLEVMASRLILAEDITVSSDTGSDLTVRWRTPGDIVVDSWNVRCYNDAGYEEEQKVLDTEAFFQNIDLTTGYTIEITAVGMTQSARTSVSANPINITELRVDESDPQVMDLNWEYTGPDPEGGWLLMYSVDGSEMPTVIKSDTPDAAISPRIPEAKYRFTIRAADGTTVLSSTREYPSEPAPLFEDFGLKSADLTADLVKTPDDSYWRFEDVGEEAITTEFASGDSISMVLRAKESFYLPGNEVSVLYVIRNANGTVLPEFTKTGNVFWKDIWNGGDAKTGELDVPDVPTIPGEYSVSVFINGLYIARKNFTIQ